MKTHNPQEYATALGAKLATRSRHVCMFLGAGVAKACGLPDIAELQTRVHSDLELADREAFDRQLEGRNIEQVLSRLRRIAGLVTGDDTVDGLSAPQAATLDTKVCQLIVSALDIKDATLIPVVNLAAWAARANYRLPVELFTVNYDLLLETALEELGVPYFDGFVGNLRARFRTELVEALPGSENGGMPSRFVRLWKLHGSVNWARSDDHQIVRIGRPVPEDLPAAIYPSDAKYEESRRVPFVVLQDRFRRALHVPETLVLIAGYSFGDAHLNEMIFDAATRCERSEFAVFCFSDLASDLCDRAMRTPNVQLIGRTEAVLGGVRAKWEPLSDPLADLWEDGKLALPDFTHLSSYLARSSARETDLIGDDSASVVDEGSAENDA
ncbi:MAG TPA: SIR2 family protein [Candidatus Acetothermia bacterium]|nr:SIR2 family protein [Candidatus Acetothermia bacterium]